MDEILIADKKYISSKQATKITGYAKDYIGQLCREGRVPARLIGRSWYVLETAIADHRFGPPKGLVPAKEAPVPEKSVFSSAWETPRYEASEGEVLPPISLDGPTEEKEPELLERLQDSWKEWFDRVADARPVILAAAREEPIIEPIKEEEVEEVLEEAGEDGGVNIPVHAIQHSLSAELVPRIRKDVSPEPVEEKISRYEGRSRVHRVGRALHLAMGVIALIIATTAVISTGYFDTYILSNSQVSAMAGIGVYNK